MIKKNKNINFIKDYIRAFFLFSNRNINQSLLFYIFISVISPILDIFIISYITSYVVALSKGEPITQNIFKLGIFIDPTSISTYLYFLLICFITYMIKIFATYFTYYIGAIYGSSLTKKFLSSFSRISYDFYLDLKESEFINFYSENISASVSSINASFNFISSFITFFIYLLYLYLTIPFGIFSFLLFLSICNYIFVNRFIGKRIVKISRKINNINPIRVKKVLDFYSLYKVVKIYNLSKVFLNNLLKSDKKYRFLEAKAPFFISLPSITTIYLFYLIGVSIIFFQTKIGIFDLYLNLIISIGLIIQRIIPTSNLILSSLNSVKFKSIFLLEIYKIYNLMNRSIKNDIFQISIQNKNTYDIGPKNLIIFRDVNYKFDDSNVDLFTNDLSFDININSNLLITGPSGSGKSTLIDLILSLRAPTKGSIYYKKGISEFADLVTYVPQKFVEVDGTLISNLTLEKNDYDKNSDFGKLKNIINCCLLDDIVERSSKGLNQIIGNSGVQLSGGQLQRLSIARALYRDAPLLLMDEPTSSLDTKTSRKLMKNLIFFSRQNSMSIVVVSHDKFIFDLFTNKIEL